jgi:signal peptidase I
MKKFFIGLGILGAVIFVLLLVARFTGMLLFYKIPTPSNEPTIKIGNLVYTSTLKRPDPYSFITYTSEYLDSISSEYSSPGSIYIHRLCGIPGDIVEMKNSVLWVNHRNFDKGLNLNVQYKIVSKEYYLIGQDDINSNEPLGNFIMMTDSAIVTFDNSLFKKYSSMLHLVPYMITDTFNRPFKWVNIPDWTTDNFGPLKIPADSYFVLGDNRHNALDSRYFGFVKKEDLKGVVLNK